MILKCPNCSTSFKVPDGAITAEGRKVRCASCSHVWHATTAHLHSDNPRRAAPQSRAKSTPQPQHSTQQSRQARPVAMQATPPRPADFDPVMAERSRSLRDEVLSEDMPPPISAAPDSMADDLYGNDPSLTKAGPASMGAGSASAPEGASPHDDGDDISRGIQAFADKLDMNFDEDAAVGADMDDEEDDDAPDAMDDMMARLRARERRMNEERASGGRKRLKAVLWGLLIVVWLAVIAGFFLFEDSVRKLWPASESLYSMVASASDVERFREGAEELSPAVTDSPTVLKVLVDPAHTEEDHGVTQLVLSGFVENAGARAARVPKLRARLTDADGHLLEEWLFDPPGLLITRGQKLRFRETFSPVPVGLHAAQVEIVEGSFSQTEAEE